MSMPGTSADIIKRKNENANESPFALALDETLYLV
jgi:hypothetical protein